MKKRNLILLVAITLVFALVLCACSKGASYRSIKIFSFKGTCNIFRGKEELSLAKEMKIKNNDELRVKDDSQAILKLDSDKFVCVKENTNVKFVASGKENNTKTRLHVLNGGVVVEVKEKLKDSETFEIASSNSVMAIRGTQISFDVEYLGDMITTTFSILKGQTETFLYKDETMNSKLLVHDKMMSYTTALIKTTDEIYKIYDTLEKVEISDSDLKTVYDTKIEAISNKKIDEIVSATNEFERENEKVNKTIGITVPRNINYGVNPKDVIQFYDIINELENVKYLYSQNADGEFSEETNLTLGKWYVKVIADNAYESSIWEFKVIREKIEFSIPSRVEYSDNLLNKVTGVEREFDIQYSDSYAGTYTVYNPTTPLAPGEYYIKLQNDYITSEPTLVEIEKKTITLDIPSSIEYASDLNLYNYITSNVSDYEIYMINSKTAIDELYNPTYALELGDYKIYLKKDNDYYINSFIKTFKIVKININFDYDETFEYGDSVADHIRNVSMDDYEIHYSTEETGAYNIIPTANNLDAGKYYIKVVSGTYYESKPVVITITPVNNGDFSIEDAVYGADITSGISGVTFANYDVYVSSTIDGEYTLYDYATMMQEQNILDVGTYYAKVVSSDGNYFYNPQQFTISPYPFDYTLSDQIDYGFDIRNYINRPTVDTFDILISTTEDGEYTLYDPSEPLALGTYYIKLDAGSNFTVTDPKEIEVVAIRANFYYTYEATNGNGTAGVTVRANCDNFFKSMYGNATDNDGNYLYNVVVTYNNNGEKTFTFDYDHREFVVENFGNGGATADSITFTYAYNMPDKVNVGSSLTEYTYTAEKSIGLESINIQHLSASYKYVISAKLSNYTFGDSELVARYIPNNSSTDFTWDDVDTLNYNSTYGTYTFEVQENEIGSDNAIRVYYAIRYTDEYSNYQYDPSTDVTTFDLTLLDGISEGTTFELNYNNDPLYTFNTDRTINIYKDFEFVDKTDNNLIYEIGYAPVTEREAEYEYDYSKTKYYRTSDQLVVLEDLPYDNYGVTSIRIIRIIDDVEYIIYDYYEDGGSFLPTDTANAAILYMASSPLAYYNDGETFTLICYDKTLLPDEDGNMILTAQDYDSPENTYVFSEFINNKCEIELPGVYEITLDYEFTEAMLLSRTLQDAIYGGTHTERMKVINDEVFEDIAMYMDLTYGITIKGIHYISRTARETLGQV